MAFRLYFTDKANDDITAHKKAGNRAILNKLFTLLNELAEHPYTASLDDVNSGWTTVIPDAPPQCLTRR